MGEASGLFTVNALYQLDPSFLRIFTMNGILDFVKFFFCIYCYSHGFVCVCFISFSLLVCCIKWFSNVEPALHFLSKFHLDRSILSFMYCLICEYFVVNFLCSWEILVCSFEISLCKCPAWPEMVYPGSQSPSQLWAIYFLFLALFSIKAFPSTPFCHSPDGDLSSWSVKVCVI